MTPEQIAALPDDAIAEALEAAGNLAWSVADIRDSGGDGYVPRSILAHAATIVRLREASEVLEWIDLHSADQDMNHVNFRIEAGSHARATLKGTDA